MTFENAVVSNFAVFLSFLHFRHFSLHDCIFLVSDEGTPGSTAEVERFFMQVIAACLQGSPTRGGNGITVGKSDKQVMMMMSSFDAACCKNFCLML